MSFFFFFYIIIDKFYIANCLDVNVLKGNFKIIVMRQNLSEETVQKQEQRNGDNKFGLIM